MATPIRLTLTTELADRYEALAQHRGQPQEDLMLAALADYLDARAAEEARLDAAIAAAARGEVVDAAVVHAEEEARLLARGLTPEQLAAIRTEVFAEMEDAYGIPLCGYSAPPRPARPPIMPSRPWTM